MAAETNPMTAASDGDVPSITNRDALAAAALGFASPLLFAAVTHEVWEDYYITYRSSRNLAEGNGLVYQIGEHVHTFTSPLGALLPSLGLMLTGSDTGALWSFRVLSAAALAAAAYLVVLHMREHHFPRPAAWMAAILGVCEAKTVAYSSNGMETALLTLFAALCWRELTRPAGTRTPVLACAYAGLMWTRPDAFIVAGAMTLAWGLFRERTTAPSSWFKRVAAAVAIGGLLYAPWVLWAWWFYGSPIPQTIIAKSVYTPAGLSIWKVLAAPLDCLTWPTGLDGLFLPVYGESGGWPPELLNVLRILARIAAFAWIAPSLPRMVRAASLAVMVGGCYLHQIMPYPWYFAPWTLLAAVVLSGTASHLALHSAAAVRSASRILATGTVCLVILLGVCEGRRAYVQQRTVEDLGRRKIGLWLKAHSGGSDTVFCEPIGYIGYYSQRRILDYPGLCSPAVSKIVRTQKGSYRTILDALHPKWLVLRPYEIANQHLDAGDALRDYTFVSNWSCLKEIDSYSFVPGRASLEFDAQFVLFHRRPDAGDGG
jgi:hypothetical protein